MCVCVCVSERDSKGKRVRGKKGQEESVCGWKEEGRHMQVNDNQRQIE